MSESSKIINSLLVGTSFVGFTFHTSFLLRFQRNNPYDKKLKLPTTLELHLDTDWWFDSIDKWQLKVAHLTKDQKPKPVGPDELVQAFELAHLRFSEGATIESVNIETDIMSILFENGKIMNVSNKNEIGGWIINEEGVDEQNWKWFAICESKEGEIVTGMPR
jgi:hypothetical protein